MKLVYEFSCVSCETDWTVGLSDDQNDEWLSVIHCPCCSEEAFPIAGPLVKTINLEGWEYQATLLLRENKFVGAVKVCREITGWELRKAKSEVERLPEWVEMKKRQANE